MFRLISALLGFAAVSGCAFFDDRHHRDDDHRGRDCRFAEHECATGFVCVEDEGDWICVEDSSDAGRVEVGEGEGTAGP